MTADGRTHQTISVRRSSRWAGAGAQFTYLQVAGEGLASAAPGASPRADRLMDWEVGGDYPVPVEKQSAAPTSRRNPFVEAERWLAAGAQSAGTPAWPWSSGSVSATTSK